jgi:hypothetical protein
VRRPAETTAEILEEGDEFASANRTVDAWSGLIHCHVCHALFDAVMPCPKCGHQYSLEPRIIVIDGVEHQTAATFAGAMSWSTHALLKLMQRERERPAAPEENFWSGPPEKQPAQKMVIVILFWTLFEHVMDRFFAVATHALPPGVRNDLLRRYQGIGARTDRLYRMLFDTPLQQDLTSLGYGDAYEHLMKVQDRRNRFVHGQAEAIDNTLVYETVEKLHAVQAAWVALYNARCTRNPNGPPVRRFNLPTEPRGNYGMAPKDHRSSRTNS